MTGPLIPGRGWGRPVPEVLLDESGWHGAWQRTVRTDTLRHLIDRLGDRGALHNLRRVIGESAGERIGFVFSDSDVYKTLEAIGLEAGRCLTARETLAADLAAFVDDVVALLGRVQRPDGYLNSAGQTDGRIPWSNLRWDHELYCLGHLIQAAVVWARLGHDELLRIARRGVEPVLARWRAGQSVLCGHPEIETALVELYRLTGEEELLLLASAMIDGRGHRTFASDPLGAAYFQDHEPLREATGVAGHAVRQLYLLAGAADVAVESGDESLWAATSRLWQDAHETRMHLSGGMGSRHRDEAFGDRYELPADRGYAETCAAVADIQLSWRMLLATGEARYGAAIDRALHNAVRAGMGRDGRSFLYSCPLQVRTERVGEHGQAPGARQDWYECACCPPNIARLVLALRHLVAARTSEGLALLLPLSADIPCEGATLRVRTELPHGGSIRLTVDAPAPESLRIRLPEGHQPPTVRRDGHPVPAVVDEGWLTLTDGWTEVEVTILPRLRLVAAHHRTDALRGQRAVLGGTVLYALEGRALPDGVVSEDVALAGEPRWRDGRVCVPLRRIADESEPYPEASAATVGESFEVNLVPFGDWGNEGGTAMRVFLPTVRGLS